MSVLPHAGLVAWLSRAFAACGVDDAPARHAAEVLVRADARGIETHGLVRALPYVEKLQAGTLRARPELRWDDSGGVLHCHADRGLGPAVGTLAVDETLARVRTAGAQITILHEVGHLAALGMFALRAAEAGMLCLLMQATPRVMGLPGSKGAAIGNNPLAFATPVRGAAPLVFDIAASAVARGSIARAARAGEAIPDDWAIDENGEPTTDPAAALRGALLPMSGHKGIGLAMMVECLAGSLSGVRAPEPGSPEGVGAPSRVGAFLLVVNPELATGREAYDAHMRDWIAAYKRASGAQGRYPGERAAALEQERRAAGIPVAETTLRDLARVGELTGVPFDLPGAP